MLENQFEEKKTPSEQKYDEMMKRVIMVADHVIETGDSTRQTAKYFSDLGIPISNFTVSEDLRKRLPKVDPRKYKLVKSMIDKNTPKTIETVEVRKRIYTAVSLLFRGLTVSQIVEEMNQNGDHVTFDIIYDDLTRRLKAIEKDPAILSDVQKRLTENRLENLNNYGTNGPNLSTLTQSRNPDGTFANSRKK